MTAPPRPGEAEAVEAIHAASCNVPGCLARSDAQRNVTLAYDIIARAVREQLAEQWRTLVRIGNTPGVDITAHDWDVYTEALDALGPMSVLLRDVGDVAAWIEQQ